MYNIFGLPRCSSEPKTAARSLHLPASSFFNFQSVVLSVDGDLPTSNMNTVHPINHPQLNTFEPFLLRDLLGTRWLSRRTSRVSVRWAFLQRLSSGPRFSSRSKTGGLVVRAGRGPPSVSVSNTPSIRLMNPPCPLAWKSTSR
jgi:hypothetical protein